MPLGVREAVRVGAQGSARRELLRIVDHFDHTHHAAIAMKENMAVIDESAGVVLKRDPDHHLAMTGKDHRILPASRVVRLTIDCDDLEIVDVDVERMLVIIHIA